ncbi:mitochondrial import inner membrane translocase subunit TIM21 [Paragonimus westermani]|uniref:Mitochondrial import inner membrane translocase subunit Tim21 n=1 Tax=Paragonimus westermani TaxID=34504 RepID=A0A5J4NNB5_9TREM|nr:mitochondrial import inner membrane translocase subunit TIM21 [Paragonimus westermani]
MLSFCRRTKIHVSLPFCLRAAIFSSSAESSGAKHVKSAIRPSSGAESRLPSTHVVKVKQAVKDVGYTGVIIGGIALTGFIFYAILRELFSKRSPNGVYNEAFKLCKNDIRVQDLLGSNIKAHGETNRRGRRRYTAHQSWYDDKGRLHMAMKFYLQGTLGSGVVYLEVFENDAKEFEYRHLLVESEGGFSKKQVLVRPQESVLDPS